MSAHAIVIGIDAYSDTSMHLTSAVADACRFAQWACDRGGVAPADLHLALAPHSEELPLDATVARAKQARGEVSEATRRAINTILAAYRNGRRGTGTRRLYFYFAGHGLAGGGLTRIARSEPVIIPADFKTPAEDSHLLLGFSDIIPALREHAPLEQIFFIDACRGYAPPDTQPAPGQAMVYVPPPSIVQQAAQCVLYGASLGATAVEHEGRGVFTSALLDALRGDLVELSYVHERAAFRMTFGALASAVGAMMSRRTAGTQVPEPRVLGDSTLEMPDISIDGLRTVGVELVLQPSTLGAECEIELLEFSLARRDLVVTEQIRAGADARARLELPPGKYTLRVRGAEAAAKLPLSVVRTSDGKLPVTVRLRRELTTRTPESYVPRGLQMLKSGPRSTRGRVELTCADPHVDIVLSRNGRELARARAGLRADKLIPGTYRVEVEATHAFGEDIAVFADETTTRVLEVPDEQHVRSDLAFLAKPPFGITVAEGFVTMPGIATPLASPSVKEVLALHVQRIPVPTIAADQTLVRVIVACPDAPARLGRVGIAIEHAEPEKRRVLRDPKPLGKAVVIFEEVITPGFLQLRLDLPGIAQTTLAAVAFPGDVLGVIVELHGTTECRAVVHLAQLRADVPVEVVRELDRLHYVIRAHGLVEPRVVDRAVAAMDAAPLYALLAMMNAREPPPAAAIAHLASVPFLAACSDVAQLRGEPPRGFAVTSAAARSHERIVGRELLPNTTWATWVQDRPALHTHGASFAKAPPSWSIVEAHRDRLTDALGAVGAVLLEGRPCATAWLVEPDVAMTVSFLSEKPGALAFQFGQVLRGTPIARDESSFVATYRLERPVARVPLRVSKTQPPIGSPAVLIAARINVATWAAEICVSPGIVIARRPASTIPIAGVEVVGPLVHEVLVHDCASMPGSAGGPLIDLDAQVIGLHHSGEAGLLRQGVATLLAP